MSTRTINYTVAVHHEDDGSMWAEVHELPGCFASGDDLDELREALQEAISLYLADDPEAGTIRAMEKVSDTPVRPMTIDEMRVTVPA